jgi:hypothetical protein
MVVVLAFVRLVASARSANLTADMKKPQQQDSQPLTSSVATPTSELPRGLVTESTVDKLLSIGASGEVVELARELAGE